ELAGFDVQRPAVRGGHVTAQLRQHFLHLYPGAEILAIEPLAPDTGVSAGSTEKAAGYRPPVRVVLVEPSGQRHELVWRTASANEFGHDRRADRVAGIVQSYEDFSATPAHVAAIDIGFIAPDRTLRSTRDPGEPYLITRFAPGTIYASDLRRIAATRAV